MADSKQYVAKAYAKINLTLDVLDKRADGYHNIRSVMQSIGLYDLLYFMKTDDEAIVLSCDNETLSVGDDNLIMRAAKRMKEYYGFPGGLQIYLEKRIPMQAGLGGGSADAAATLKAINEIYSLGISDADLADIGAGLGSDVPFCVYGGRGLVESMGETVTRLDDGGETYDLVLIKTDISVSTPWAYGKIDAAGDTLKHPDVMDTVSRIWENREDEEYLKSLGNVFEDVILPEYPALTEIKRFLTALGADFTMMSGSGPTIYGIYKKPITLEMQAGIKDVFPGKEIFFTTISKTGYEMI